jgi:hypothetical protein
LVELADRNIDSLELCIPLTGNNRPCNEIHIFQESQGRKAVFQKEFSFQQEMLEVDFEEEIKFCMSSCFLPLFLLSSVTTQGSLEPRVFCLTVLNPNFSASFLHGIFDSLAHSCCAGRRIRTHFKV